MDTACNLLELKVQFLTIELFPPLSQSAFCPIPVTVKAQLSTLLLFPEIINE